MADERTEALLAELNALVKEAKDKTGLDWPVFAKYAGIPYSTAWNWFGRPRKGYHPSAQDLISMTLVACQITGEPFLPRLERIVRSVNVLGPLLTQHELPQSIDMRVLDEVEHCGSFSYPMDAVGSAILVASLAPVETKKRRQLEALRDVWGLPDEAQTMLERYAYHSRDHYFRPIVEGLAGEDHERYMQLMRNLARLAQILIEERRRSGSLTPSNYHVLCNSVGLIVGLGPKDMADEIVSQIRHLWVPGAGTAGDILVARETFRSAASRSHYDRRFAAAARLMTDFLEMTVHDTAMSTMVGRISLGCENLYFQPSLVAAGTLVPDMSLARHEHARVVLRNILAHLLQPQYPLSVINYAVMLWLLFKMRGGYIMGDVNEGIIRDMRGLLDGENPLLDFDKPFQEAGRDLRNWMSEVVRLWPLRLRWSEKEDHLQGE